MEKSRILNEFCAMARYNRKLPRVDWIFTFALAAYNLVRIRNLALATA